MNKCYKVITFDMGNTLVAVEPFVQVFVRICQSLGVPVQAQVMEEAVEAVWHEVVAQDATAIFETTPTASRQWWRDVNLRSLHLAGIPPEHLETVEEGFNTILEEPASYTIYPETLDTLIALRREGYRLGVISNWGWILPDLCRHWGLDGHLDFVMASARVGYAKPNPRIFQEALRQAGVSAHEMLHVGDSHYADVLGAQAVGIDAVLVNRDGKCPPDNCLVVRGLDELLTRTLRIPSPTPAR